VSVVEIATEPANFAATSLDAAQLPATEAVEAATVIPPPARQAQPLEDLAGPIRRDLYPSGYVTGSAEAWRRLEEGFARERAMAGVVVHASLLAAHEAEAEARRKAACSSVGFRSLLVAHGLDARVRSRQLRAGRRALP
jgi:hypothetical protein